MLRLNGGSKYVAGKRREEVCCKVSLEVKKEYSKAKKK